MGCEDTPCVVLLSRTVHSNIQHWGYTSQRKMALPVLNPVESTHFIRGFPKVDHSDRSARIVLEQINSAKKTTSNRT